MEKRYCYVILMHWPNIDCPEHEVTNLLEVTSSLSLAERAIANYCKSNGFGEDGESLICDLMPTLNDVRSYYMKKHFAKKTATYFTVTEEEIDKEWALA